MILFKIATAKNFLSCGNVKTEFNLSKHKSTLIIGQNGQGKSLLVDLVCFALYGKPYRNINKPQLINSINGKNCETTIEFSVGVDEYKVVRGIKPAIFEIYKNEKLIDQEAATRDYQGYLEKVILKINYKTFCQVVVMGSAAFTPFMQLPTGQRRDVIEDVLDIAIFSSMNDLLKIRMNDNKDDMKQVENSLLMAKKDTEAQKRIIALLSEARETQIKQIQDEIEHKHEAITQIRSNISNFKSEIENIKKSQKAFNDKEFEKLLREQSVTEHEIDRLENTVESLNSMTDCPRCLQSVEHDHKTHIGKKSQEKIFDLQNKLVKISNSISEMKIVKDFNQELSKKSIKVKASWDSENEKLDETQTEIERLQKNILKLNGDNGDVETEKKKLKDITDKAMKVLKQRGVLLEIKNIQEISQLLLKDSGIKAAIIKEYIPIINKLINRYLSIFGFNVNFILDETFNETIKSRGRDDFSYNSFSEGEKRRIDVAILFAFRQVSELKNSANCNLLIMDEIVDSSLDLNSREAFLEILNSEKGNTFVISHTAPSYDAFEAVIKAEKRGDFSCYEFIS